MSIEAIKKALEGVTPDRVERLWWFLHIMSKSSGSTNADDDKWNWINAFCTDYEDDTFNRAEKLGFIEVSHDSFMETYKAGMTPAGFSFINYFEKAPSASLVSEIDRLQRESEELQELSRAFEAEANQLREVSISNRHRADRAQAELKRLEEWRPIGEADKSIVYHQHFPTINMTLRNSERYWVRDADGRVYESSWSEGKNGRDFWWDWEGESPADPVEFMPHPLSRTALSSTGGEHHAE